jgi:hypothetical protein
MRMAATVLDVIQERGRRGLPLERLYRQLFNPQLFLLSVDRTTWRHAGMVDALAVGWPVELTRLFRRETHRAVGWARGAGHRLDLVAAVGPGR